MISEFFLNRHVKITYFKCYGGTDFEELEGVITHSIDGFVGLDGKTVINSKFISKIQLLDEK